MYAIVDVEGKQFKVESGSVIMAPYIDMDSGAKLTIDKVLYLKDDSGIQIGKPYLDKVKVEAYVLDHMKDKKVIVFKKKRRKGYKVKRGHRQLYTLLEISSIKTEGKKAATRGKKKSSKAEKQEPEKTAVEEKTTGEE